MYLFHRYIFLYCPISEYPLFLTNAVFHNYFVLKIFNRYIKNIPIFKFASSVYSDNYQCGLLQKSTYKTVHDLK